MALNDNDQTRIREFLLGRLSDDEQQKLEERLLVDDDLFQELEISKGELVEEYCANELSHEENQWLERHFLSSPEGKERYSLAVTLSHLQRPPTPTPTPRRLTFFERLQNLFKQHSWMMATVSAAAVVVIVGAIFLSRPAGQTVAGPTLASVIPNRNEGPLPAKFTVPANASEIKFRLLLPSDVQGASYSAELDNRIDTTPAKVVEQDREAVSVVIPVSQLPRGAYSLRLEAIMPDGKKRAIPGEYYFNIE